MVALKSNFVCVIILGQFTIYFGPQLVISFK